MLPPVDIGYIVEELRMHSKEIVEAFEDQDGDSNSDPQILLQALNDLFEGLHARTALVSDVEVVDDYPLNRRKLSQRSSLL